MQVNIGWLFTAILFGALLGKWFGDFIPVLALVNVIAQTIYALCVIFTETH